MPRPAALVLAFGLVAAVAAGDTASACTVPYPPHEVLSLELTELTVDGAAQALPTRAPPEVHGSGLQGWVLLQDGDVRMQYAPTP